MTTQLQLADLSPFKAALIAEASATGALPVMSQLVRKLKRELGIASTTGDRRKLHEHVQDVATATTPAHAFVHYRDRRPVAWTRAHIFDDEHHLLLIVAVGDYVAITSTEGGKREKLLRVVRRGALGPIGLVDPARLKGAFVQGDARTLWLKGTHRRASHKPDNKVFTGSDLGGALDPSSDQTYRYTAVRSTVSDPRIGDVIGLAVDQSRIWVGPSKDWPDYRDTINAVLEVVQQAIPVTEDPLPVLAQAVTDIAQLSGPFDLSATPPELLTLGPPQSPGELRKLEALERLAYHTVFDVQPTGGASLRAAVTVDRVSIGDVLVDIGVTSDGIATTTVQPGAAAPGHDQELLELAAQLDDPDLLTVHYDSGHVVMNRQIFAVRHRDLPFEGWKWADLAAYQVDLEKPDPLTALGSQTSLFDWVYANWASFVGSPAQSGWLACDDRAGETADFIHLDEPGVGPPTLSLIHVKGAHSASPKRQIAVVPYETVGSQAVKNLRHLDRVLLQPTLMSGTTALIGNLVWENGSQRTEPSSSSACRRSARTIAGASSSCSRTSCKPGSAPSAPRSRGSPLTKRGAGSWIRCCWDSKPTSRASARNS